MKISNTTFTSNTANTDYGYGGAIYNTGSTIIDNCSFMDNNAIYGGAIYNYYDGILIITGTSFSNNSAVDGGAIYNYAGPLTINNSSIINNNAIDGGAIYEYFCNGPVNINFNQILGNIANTGSAIYNGDGMFNGDGIVDASLNWWGSNADPSSSMYGSVNVMPWLVLTIVNNPYIIPNGGNSTITADLLHDSNGNYHDPSNGHVIDGIPISFNGTLGTLYTTSTLIINGQAQTLLTGNNLGAANITIIVDNQTLNTTINVIPLTVNSIDPSNNTKINVANKPITVIFSLPIQASDAYGNISIMGSSGIIRLISNINGNILTLTPTSNYSDGNYILYIPVNAVKDLVGNSLALPFNSIFTIDTTAPTVNITNLVSSEYVHGNVFVNVTSIDNVGVSQVVFNTPTGNYVDNNGTDGWSYNWITTGLPDGVYNITATAYDEAGNTQSQTMTVNVDNTAPTVTASLPSGISNNTQVTLNATDNLDNNPLIYYSADNGSTGKIKLI